MNDSKQAFRYESMQPEDYDLLNQQLSGKDALDVIRWAFQQYEDDLAYACSFGAEAMVLLDLISQIRPDASIIFLDTGVHFPETYQLIEQVKKRYPRLRINMVEPELTLAEQAAAHGDALWERDPDLCCQIRKIDPLKNAMAGRVAWLSGLRREQSPTRAHLRYVNPDHKFANVKVCPLIDWKQEEIWMYIKLHQLPYNPLHDLMYPSIGCQPCTRPVQPGEDERAGRWAGSGKTECGLHK
ncbi:phosphoadenylyl-sulfate reductase [Brevibacillus migulae]|uniref:phosphoadenylyl-sulfate reductase n=1 Tax=Brevibacillus migulae TaxID=1644114 RepID=UPI002E267933